jgi:thioredoxin-dependent adenylylsulfate APS reductase
LYTLRIDIMNTNTASARIPTDEPAPASEAPLDVLNWAASRFEHVGFATGFGMEGCVLIDIIGRNRLPIDIFTLDTGLLFPETYELWRRLERRYGITIRAVRPVHDVAQQAAISGPDLWIHDPNRCCELRKVIPLKSVLSELDAWITGVRREQSRTRANVKVVDWDETFGLVKVNPLAAWSTRDVWKHLLDHDVPYNPLHDKGYPSIGCQPCTTPVAAGEDPRSGRWRGQGKTECGIHVVPLVRKDQLAGPGPTLAKDSA